MVSVDSGGDLVSLRVPNSNDRGGKVAKSRLGESVMLLVRRQCERRAPLGSEDFGVKRSTCVWHLAAHYPEATPRLRACDRFASYTLLVPASPRFDFASIRFQALVETAHCMGRNDVPGEEVLASWSMSWMLTLFLFVASCFI